MTKESSAISTSFPSSAWERIPAKLRFAEVSREEKQSFSGFMFPSRSLGTSWNRIMRAGCPRSRLRDELLLFCVLMAVATCWPTVAAETKGPAQPPTTKQPPTAKQPPAARQPPAQPSAAKSDVFPVPEGTPDQLFEYIEKLKAIPPGLTPEAEQQYANKANRTIVKVAEKIFASRPDQQQTQAAIETKMWALFLLEQSGDAEAGKRLAAFPAELLKAGRPKSARQVRGFLLQSRFQQVRPGEVDAITKALGDVKQFLSEAPLGEPDVDLMMAAAQAAEMTGKTELAVDAYRGFAKMLTDSHNPQIAPAAKFMESIVRRLTLMGNKMEVQGKIVGGEPLDWTKYAGKVVLVDFWATWCGPCLQELPNVIETYRLYHDRGFEVIGLSCDQSREDLENFLQKNPSPWPIVYDDQGPSPTVEYYGITALPTMILVGADGKVVSIDASGPRLRQALEKLLGPAEEQKPKEPGEEKDQGKEAKKPAGA